MRKAANDYGLGDVIKKATSAVGIKPCSGCQKRAEKLNDWGRRSFLGRAIMSLAIAKTSFLNGFITASEAEALGALEVMRTLVGMQFTFFHFDFADGGSRHKFPTRDELLGAVEPGLEWAVQSNAANTDTKAWKFWHALVPNDRNGEILAGWITDIHIEENRFVIVMSQKVDEANPGAGRDVFISDQNVIIYRTRINGPLQPAANSLAQASDFPGATPINLYSEYREASSVGKARYAFRSVAYRLWNPPLVSQCWNQCTGVFGSCGGLCVGSGWTCPCPNPPCDPASPVSYPCYAGKVCGATDCVWCVWQACDSSDCPNATACKTFNPGNPTCCTCPKCHLHCGG